MAGSTRRDFLTTTSLAVAGTLLGARRGQAARVHVLPPHAGSSTLTADRCIPASLAPSMLSALATRAIDAARDAGAAYADVRVAERYLLRLDWYPGGSIEAGVDLTSVFTYGIRVLVDGTWAFVHGTSPTADAVAASARDAVAMARGYARVTTRRVELPPTPVVIGEWVSPMQEDPFTVPFRDQSAMMGAWSEAGLRVRYATLQAPLAFDWTRETRVFASSEGSLVTQTFRRLEPTVRVTAECLFGPVSLGFPGVSASSGGFELVANPAIQDDLTRACAEAVRLAALPRRLLDVGRYPVVFDGRTTGMVLGRTLGAALELDQVLGYEADASGTSFLGPADTVLNQPLLSPLLTVTGSRAAPMLSAVKWDDDGVEPHEYPVITDGRVVDYHTSRPTVSALGSIYTQRGQPLRSHGCMVAPDAGDPPLVRAPHLIMAPSTTSASVEDLCKGITRGVLVLDRNYLSTDQQLTSASFTTRPRISFDGVLLEIEKGHVVRRLDGNGLQLGTSPFWKKQLIALGDTRTVQESSFLMDKGMPWRSVRQSAAAPAVLFKDVSVISTQISL